MQKIFALAAIVLTACSPEPQAPQSQSAPLQCAADTACKGDRICVNGQCQAPATTQASGVGAEIEMPAAPETSYSGIPSEDDRFSEFIEKNAGNLVTLDIVTTDEDSDSMPEGYRGGDPSFMGKPVGGTNRQYVISCDAYPEEYGLDRCGKLVTWDEPGKQLQGTFRVSGVEKHPRAWVYTLKPETP